MLRGTRNPTFIGILFNLILQKSFPKKEKTDEQDEENRDEEKQAEVPASPPKKKKKPGFDVAAQRKKLKPAKFRGKRGNKPSDVLEKEVEEKLAEWEDDEPPHYTVSQWEQAKSNTSTLWQAAKKGVKNQAMEDMARWLAGGDMWPPSHGRGGAERER